MFAFEPRLALVAIAIIPVVAAVNKWYGNWLNQNQNKVQVPRSLSLAFESPRDLRVARQNILMQNILYLVDANSSTEQVTHNDIVQAALASANSVAHEAVGSFRTVYR